MTRERPHIDRIACAWTVKRFIDSEAEFLFIRGREKLPGGAVPYDLPGG
ncbi:MAG: chromate resistance protein [Candidatus Hydrothermarchaeota archaeon]|nr:chromate resistance protein [Candidatus Hydrothermarchaeota archaeon]